MAELPKQELLIKLLGMSSSSNDGEALVAIRKANRLLADAGWSWEQLIRGKITIVEDPFNALDRQNGGNPFDAHINRPTASAAPPPRPTPPRQPNPTQHPTFKQNIPFQASNSKPIGSNLNKYVGYCYCCGIEVPANTGRHFRPNAYNPAASDKWAVICMPCTTTGTIYVNATGQRPGKKRGKADINSLI